MQQHVACSFLARISSKTYTNGVVLAQRRTIIHQAEKPAKHRDIDFSLLKLKFPMTHDTKVVINKTQWTRPPEKRPDLPFMVDRTTMGEALPVYTKYIGGRTKVVTILRKCRGDVELLKSEMEKVVDGNKVSVRPGKLVVDGNYHARLKKWLTGLGF